MKEPCWDHCKTCGRSQNRFEATTKQQFRDERVETLGHRCQFCGGKMKSYHGHGKGITNDPESGWPEGFPDTQEELISRIKNQT